MNVSCVLNLNESEIEEVSILTLELVGLEFM